MHKEYILLNGFRKAKKGFTAGFHVPLMSFPCCVPANSDIRQAKTFLFIVSPVIKLQGESGYSKAVVICLYCERCAGKFDSRGDRG